MTGRIELSVGLLAMLGLVGPALAQSALGLPPGEAVTGAIEESPSVRAAQARIDAASENARALKAGPHEFTVAGAVGRRSIEQEGSYVEYEASVERGIRLPGKSALDRRAGALGITAAEHRLADARHRAALLLNDLWWDWLGANADVGSGETSVANLSASLNAVSRRVTLQDAAKVDEDQARAALAGEERLLEQARNRAGVARARLAVLFPSLPLPIEAPDLPIPEQPDENLDTLAQSALRQSHDLNGLQAEVDRLAALAARARLDRLADPTIGARVFAERGGLEKGFGITASIPLGGRGRSALARQAEAEARVATAEYAAGRFGVLETATVGPIEAESAWRAWQRSVVALTNSQQAASRLRQGYRLGGIDLSDLLYAERQAQEATRAENMVRVDALRAIAKLRINAHQLWSANHEGNAL